MQHKKLLRMTIASIASVCMLFSFAACGENTPPDDNTGDDPPIVDDDTSKHIYHTYEWEITEEPTCLTKGSKSDICSCGDIRAIEAVSALGHDMHQGVCSRCKREETDGVEIILNEDGESYYLSKLLDEKETDVIIPAFYEGKPITVIDENLFYDLKSVTSVTIQDTVTMIGASAFVNSGITVLSIGSGLTDITPGAFSQCNDLESIIISKDNPKYYTEGNCIIEKETKTLIAGFPTSQIPGDVTFLGQYAFAGCDFTSIIIPDNVITIGVSAFYLCSNLTNITIGRGVTSIDETAFADCRMSNIVIPKNVTSIGAAVFMSCSRMTTITYEGTISEWEDLSKGGFVENRFFTWNHASSITTVQCSDGDITL